MAKFMGSAFVILFLAIAAPVEAQELKRITMGYPSLAFTQSHIWVGKEQGLFREYGVEVDPVFLRGGQVATQALAAGEPPMVNVGTVIQANLTGYNLVLVASMENNFYQLVFVRPGITSLEQLKGKKLAISGFGSITHYAAQILAKHLNLEINKDLILVPGGPDAERLGAMSAGTVDASFFNLSTAPIARKMGFVDLLQIADLGVEVQGNGLATSRAYLKNSRDVVKNVMRGYLEAIHFIHARKAESQKVFAKYMRTNEPEVLETSYQNYVKTIPRKPTFTPKGIQFILDMLAPQMPQAKSAKPEQFYDATGELSAFDFHCILIWKSNRAKKWTSSRLQRIGGQTYSEAVSCLIASLVKAQEPKERLRLLMRKWKLALPTASAILTILYPKEFTVYDTRVCSQVGRFKELANRVFTDHLWDAYLEFKDCVVQITPKISCLRDKDRYLWGKSFYEQVTEEITK